MEDGEQLAIAIGKHEGNGLDSTQVVRTDFEYDSGVGFIQHQFREQVGTQAGVANKIQSLIHPKRTVLGQFNLLSSRPVGPDQTVTYPDPSQTDRPENSLKQHW